MYVCIKSQKNVALLVQKLILVFKYNDNEIYRKK